MKCYLNPKRVYGAINPMIYGHFIEFFHRQIYGGIYDPASPLADKDGLRSDVGATPVTIRENDCVLRDGAALVTLPPHSVNLIVLH